MMRFLYWIFVLTVFSSNILAATQILEDNLSGSIYIDFEMDQAPSFILNEHYRLQVEGRKILTPSSYADFRLDTALFDWDTPLFQSDRLRYIPEFSYTIFTDFLISDSKASFYYGPGEFVNFHKKVFSKHSSGLSLEMPFGTTVTSFELWLKPTFTAESNVKQLRIVSSYPYSDTLQFKGSVEFSSNDTGNFFSRSAGRYDEKVAGEVIWKPSDSRNFSLYSALGNSGNALDVQATDEFPFIPQSTLSVRYQRVADQFLNATLKNYYSDYHAVSPLDETIDNGASVASAELQLTDSASLWKGGVYYRTATNSPAITTFRAAWQTALYANSTTGIDVRYSSPYSYGQGYTWELKWFMQLSLK